MHLLRTGAFVRATRATRLATPHRGPHLASRVTSSRCQSSQVQVRVAEKHQEALPEQSVLVNHEADAHKTVRGSQDPEEGEKKSFARWIQDHGVEGKILGRGKLHGSKICGRSYVFDDTSNLSPSILNIIGRDLYNTPDHPICITRKLIESTFSPADHFKNHIATDPVATTHANFDVLGFPPDHPGRSRTDTYYVDSTHVLRTHTSAHQHTAFLDLAETTRGESGYTICADVYRRDAIDRSHFPAFHQMEGAYLWQLPKASTRFAAMKKRWDMMAASIESAQLRRTFIAQELGQTLDVQDIPHFDLKSNPPQPHHDDKEVELAAIHLKLSLEILVCNVFNMARQANLSPATASEPLQMRWIEAYFPFTSPSFELEVFWQGEWLELLGCGIVQQQILDKANLNDRMGWAWGIGIERLAMLLFGIPDIRLFWSEDQRFLSQFKQGKITRFEPFSKYPACYKDVAFWIDASPAAASPLHAQSSSSIAAAAGGDSTKANPTETQPAAFHENDVMEIVRDVGGTLVEDVRLTDEFIHPGTGRKSLCYRINYRSLERTLTNEEVNELHKKITTKLIGDLGLELR